MYNSEVWPEIVLFGPSLPDRGGGVAGAAKAVGDLNPGGDPGVCLHFWCLAEPGGGQRSFKSHLQGSLLKLRGPPSSLPHSHPQILQPGEMGSPKGQLGEQSGELLCPHSHVPGPGIPTCMSSAPGHFPRAQDGRDTAQLRRLHPSCLHSPINQ